MFHYIQNGNIWIGIILCSNGSLSIFSGIGTRLEESLGAIEKVRGYIVVRESSSLKSLNFLKNLKEIEPPTLLSFINPLYNGRYDHKKVSANTVT